MIEADFDRALLHYDQQTPKVPSQEPSHWESGFIRPTEDGAIELSSAQSGGRVEVLRGFLPEIPSADALTLELRSVVLANDYRMVESRRAITLDGDRLHYVQYMATTTTATPEMQMHLEATLERQR